MAKMTKEELKKRKAELKKLVHAEITKREVMQFRLEPENIDKLYHIAAQQRKPVGTLVREWIIERINIEASGKISRSTKSTESVPQSVFHLALDKLRSDLQKPLDELNRRVCHVEEITSYFGKIDFDKEYDYKRGRSR